MLSLSTWIKRAGQKHFYYFNKGDNWIVSLFVSFFLKKGTQMFWEFHLMLGFCFKTEAHWMTS